MKRIIPLSQLLTFKSVYREDDNWAALLVEMQADPVHWRVVQQLAEELRRNRFFREPVYVGKDPESDPPDAHWVFDGTHRTCAYLLAGASEAEVLFEEDDDSGWVEPKWLVETRIIGENGYMMDYEGEDEEPSLWSALMSLRVNDEIWLTSDTSSGNDEGLTVFWDSDAPKVSDAQINALAIAQLSSFGFDMSKLTITTARRINDLEGAE